MTLYLSALLVCQSYNNDVKDTVEIKFLTNYSAGENMRNSAISFL